MENMDMELSIPKNESDSVQAKNRNKRRTLKKILLVGTILIVAFGLVGFLIIKVVTKLGLVSKEVNQQEKDSISRDVKIPTLHPHLVLPAVSIHPYQSSEEVNKLRAHTIECSETYFFKTQGKEEVRLKCPDGLIWNAPVESCSTCYEVKKKNGKKCCDKVESIYSDGDY